MKHVWLLALLWGWVFAHPVDELVQAAYLKLSPDALELELDLTPGEKVAPQMLRLMDQNRDGNLSQTEVEGYAAKVLSDLSLSLDGQPQTLKLQRVSTPQTSTFLAGGGTIQLVARSNWSDRAGQHILEFSNAHQPVKSGYLANVFVQSERLQVNRQTRNSDQSLYRLEYGLAPSPGPDGRLVWGLVLVGIALVISVWIWKRSRSRKVPTI